MADLISMLAAASGATAEADPNFKQTVLLLHGDGTNGAQNNTFLDGSTNNFTITRNGNTTQGTFSPFSLAAGEWSNYFDGSGDYLELANATALQIGGGAFTIEAWIYPTNSGSYRTIISKRSGGTAEWELTLNNVDNKLVFYTSTTYITSNQVTLNAWNHIAASYDGTTLELYINGTRGFSGAMTVTNSTNVTRIGAVSPAGADFQYFPGYISNVRVIKGTALYTGTTLSVPTAPFTNITNTSLLTCQSNRFVDNSTANSGTGFAITRNGDVRVTPFSPFAPSAAYDPAVHGGSGYFDESGDFLSISTASAVAFGTGDFTVELWIYPTTLASVYVPFDSRGGGTGIAFYTNGATINVAITGVTTWFTGISLSANAWTHIALSRESSTVRFFVNGSVVGTSTQTTNFGNNTTYIGNDSYGSNRYWPGYIGNVRVVNGTAVYTAAFTPPTAPLTAITNTSLLCNFTNAGIFDNTGKNNLETVGNAQIDTTTKKFGTGSMEFDGSGDYLLLPANQTDLAIGTGDFTIEAWIYSTQNNASNAIIDFRNTLNDTNGFYFGLASGAVQIFCQNVINLTGGSVSINTWYHVALVRSSGTIKIYLNGTSVASAANTTNWSQANVTIGAALRGNNIPWFGFIDDLRITKGVARYTAAFTPPIQAFPDQ
jgi:uncharacterized protein (DUF427 family)